MASFVDMKPSTPRGTFGPLLFTQRMAASCIRSSLRFRDSRAATTKHARLFESLNPPNKFAKLNRTEEKRAAGYAASRGRVIDR